jgi:SAM-dependent methyltransferase
VSPAPAAVDPFTLPRPAPAPRRPRLLSYVGRWGRAGRWLPAEVLRILDVGCAFGYGSAALQARGPAGRLVVGVECDAEHLALGRRRFPWVTILEGDATALPVPDGVADAVVLLDVVEHLADPRRAVAEAHRVLRPGGLVVISVPHRGLLHRLDALNVYSALHRRRPHWPALEPATRSGSGVHRHFTRAELTALVQPPFAVDRVARTGLGLAELVELLALLLRGPLRAPGLARALQPLHLLVYLADDLLPAGRLGYHLTVRARATASGDGG